MKIEKLSGVDNAEQTRAARSLSNNRTAGPDSPSPLAANNATSKSDTVYISARAEIIAQLAARLAELPDVRQERVESLRATATSGAFHPEATDIADSIIREESLFSQ